MHLDIKNYIQLIERIRKLYIFIVDKGENGFFEYSKEILYINLETLLKEFRDTLLNPKKHVGEFFLNTQTSLFEIWNKTIENVIVESNRNLSGEEKKLFDFSSNLTVFIKINEYFLSFIFYNIVTNKYKYANQTPCEITLSETKDHVTLNYKQKSPYKGGNETGWLVVRKILAFFNCEYEVTDVKEYSFKISFPQNLR